jgi:hypothetical protein
VINIHIFIHHVGRLISVKAIVRPKAEEPFSEPIVIVDQLWGEFSPIDDCFGEKRQLPALARQLTPSALGGRSPLFWVLSIFTSALRPIVRDFTLKRHVKASRLRFKSD